MAARPSSFLLILKGLVIPGFSMGQTCKKVLNEKYHHLVPVITSAPCLTLDILDLTPLLL